MKSQSERDALKEIVEDQLRRHVMEVADLYKLNSQMCFGPRHLIKDKKNTRKLLQEEWDALDKVRKGEPLIEMIDPRGEVLRINLRVFRKTGGDPESLFQVMLTSAEKVQPDRDRFLWNWEYFMDMARRKTIPFSEEVLEDYLIEIGKKGFPMVHHSDRYREMNRPAYRVVLKSVWQADKGGSLL